MSLPKVAIVGRPNVGKSSILNWLARKLVSVVDPTAGVTRDRVKYVMTEGDRSFEMIDTGGVGIVDSDELSDDIERQIQVGMDEADLVLFVVDGRSGVTPLDVQVADRLRKIDKPMILVVNKCDSTKTDAEVPPFFRLAPHAPVVLTSVIGKRNRKELLEAVVENLPAKTDGSHPVGPPEMQLAIVGRRNVGKSTFINQLAEEERCIVSEVAGTTRDSVDVRFEIDGKAFVAIDTPGVRKRKSMANDIEFYGLVRAQKSIRRADVVLMFFDAMRTISRVDKQLVDEINERQKPCIFVVNKWDLGLDEGMTADKWDEYLAKTFATMRHAPVAFLTAKDGRNIHKVVNLAQSMFKQAQTRVATAELNEVVRNAMAYKPPPMRRNKRPKIYYATQVAVAPPTIVLKVNDPRVFDKSWKRYLLGVFRERLPFDEVPLRVYYRARHSNDDVSEEEYAAETS